MTPAKPLRKEDVKFQWTSEVELFVVKQYAEFTNAMDICQSVIQMFFKYCEKDIEKHGEALFTAFLLRKIYQLTPENSRFPKKYQENYNEWRKVYLKDLGNCYLSHSKNRMRELDAIYIAVRSRLQGEKDPVEFRQGAQTAMSLIKEARNEMDKGKITVEASIGDGTARVVAKKQLEELPNPVLERLLKNYESGNAIELPNTDTDTGSDRRNDLSDGTGDSTESTE